ncbi:MAG TPA: hypothetical protein VNN55_11000 [bacterium]|nr:hypothetical protein [bacterium]
MTIKRVLLTAGALLGVAIVCLFLTQRERTSPARAYFTMVHDVVAQRGKVPKAKSRPNDWFYLQRAWPGDDVPVEARMKAKDKALDLRRASAAKDAQAAPVWSDAGPTNIPGRVVDLAINPYNSSIVFAASAAGGVFKSIDGGNNWTPVFDDPGPQPMGAIAIHPINDNILYAGTGEANAATDNYEGTGIYKTIDGGASWTLVGLPNSYSIGRIVIDPLRPDTVYVAVAGRMFGTNPERGLYRSQDGGASWEQLLYINDTTGCIDVAFHASTGTILAGMWQRWRNPMQRQAGGWSTAIWRSTDFGANWTKLNGGVVPGFGLPAPSAILGRVGLAMTQNSETVYAMFDEHPGNFAGIYRSDDLGGFWSRVNDAALSGLTGGFGWYFGQIRCHPTNPEVVFALGVPLYKSVDGGASWENVTGDLHVDFHALAFSPTNGNQIYLGGDGGVAYSADAGNNFTPRANMGNSQFYAMTIDKLNPDRLYGGTQDNGTLRTLTGALSDWDRILGGDGFYTVVDFTNADVVYAEYQNGYLLKSPDLGVNFYYAMNGIDYNNDRHNWSTPFEMAPYDNEVLYYGSHRLYKTSDGAANWAPISGDLTDGDDPGNLAFGTITTIGVSPNTAGVVYVGTDDANVWVTQNDGGNWTNITAGLPNRWVTRLTVHPTNPAIAYVTLSGYKLADHEAHIYRTSDYGASWTPIDGDLFDAPINDVVIDPDYPDSALYIGTDFGVYMTHDGGQNWIPLDQGMPLLTPVHDIDFHQGTRKLVAGTHGRSMFKTVVACPDVVDADGDSVMDFCDNCPATSNPGQEDADADGIGDACEACACDCHADPVCDGVINNVLDVVLVVNVAFRGAAVAPDPSPNCPREPTDVNCDGVTGVVDAVKIVNVAFRGTNPLTEYCNPCL